MPLLQSRQFAASTSVARAERLGVVTSINCSDVFNSVPLTFLLYAKRPQKSRKTKFKSFVSKKHVVCSHSRWLWSAGDGCACGVIVVGYVRASDGLETRAPAKTLRIDAQQRALALRRYRRNALHVLWAERRTRLAAASCTRDYFMRGMPRYPCQTSSTVVQVKNRAR